MPTTGTGRRVGRADDRGQATPLATALLAIVVLDGLQRRVANRG